VDGALQRAFSIDGPVLVDVVVAKEELAIPPQIKLEQAKGFSLQQRISQATGPTEIDRLSDVDTTPVVVNGVVYALAYNGNLTAL
ncbi:hypothetical protein ONO57_25230, partial [Salmonella enterica subsp. enterica serovar Anatum]|nr:hypothetical protein [Salmonella enterica subsp. enterica serovar Anatum]